MNSHINLILPEHIKLMKPFEFIIPTVTGFVVTATIIHICVLCFCLSEKPKIVLDPIDDDDDDDDDVEEVMPQTDNLKATIERKREDMTAMCELTQVNMELENTALRNSNSIRLKNKQISELEDKVSTLQHEVYMLTKLIEDDRIQLNEKDTLIAASKVDGQIMKAHYNRMILEAKNLAFTTLIKEASELIDTQG